MSKMRIKGMVVMLVFMCLAGGVFVSGCSIPDRHSHGHQTIKAHSEKLLVMELNEKAEYQPLLVGKPQTCGMRSGRVYLLPGESIGKHSTEVHEEMLVFLSGKGTAIIGEEQVPFEVGQGKVCYIPPCTTHNIRNTGTEPLVYIYCVAPVNPGAENHPTEQENHH